MKQDSKDYFGEDKSYRKLARRVFVGFLVTFVLARIAVFLIMSRSIPDLYLYVGGTHIHHLNYGIFLLAGVGGYLLLRRPGGRSLGAAAVIYGIGMALTFDEFGMWIHLGGGYWQRASWDAITVLGACFGLLAFAPSLKKLRPHHLLTGIALLLITIIFFFMLVESFKYARRVIRPRIEKVESVEPKPAKM
jgi:hypothetical protein